MSQVSSKSGDVPLQTRRRSPLTRQPVLTQHYRRHVVVAKTTSLPLSDTPPLNTDRYRRCWYGIAFKHAQRV